VDQEVELECSMVRTNVTITPALAKNNTVECLQKRETVGESYLLRQEAGDNDKSPSGEALIEDEAMELGLHL
jgi:hypothetical protein